MSKSESTQRFLRIPLPKLAIYSQCPKKYEYSAHLPDDTARSPEVAMFKNILKVAYINKSRTGFRPSWKSITGVIDEHIFKDVDVDNKEEFKEGYKKSLKYIDNVRKSWYGPYFIEEDYEGLVDMNVGLALGDYIIHDTLDLILYNEKDVIICQFTDIDENPGTLYNDIRLRGQAMMLSREIGKYVNKIRRVAWSETGEITVQDITIHNPEEFMKTTEKALIHMANGIRKKVFYTSVSQQCFTCPFRQTCSM